MMANCLSQMSFFDPRWTSEKKPYAPERFRDIVKERYLISVHSNSSYESTASITPTERTLLLQLIKDDLQRKQEQYDKIRNQQTTRSRK